MLARAETEPRQRCTPESLAAQLVLSYKACVPRLHADGHCHLVSLLYTSLD